jgi:3-oxoacyl-[acyl-carrier-protein] synthase-3
MPAVRPLPVKIAGLGWCLPQQRVTSSELLRAWSLPEDYVEHAAGVYERRYAVHETTAGMAAAAARMALEDAALDAAEIDAIVGASTVPQQAIPCTATFVQRELGAPDGASACFDVNATCLSFLVALQNAAHLVAAGVYRRALIFSSELGSRFLNPRQPQSAILFGDAAAAAVLTRADDGEASAIHHTRFATYSSGADYTQVVGGGTRHSPNDPQTTAEMNLFDMNGRAVFRQAARLLPPFLDCFLEQAAWQREHIGCVVPHQASRHGLDLLTSHLGFRKEQVFSNLPQRGNCIAASIPLALGEAVAAGRIQRGDDVLLLGTGAGLTIGAVALTY